MHLSVLCWEDFILRFDNFQDALHIKYTKWWEIGNSLMVRCPDSTILYALRLIPDKLTIYLPAVRLYRILRSNVLLVADLDLV